MPSLWDGMSDSVAYLLWALVAIVAPVGLTLVVFLTKHSGAKVALVTAGVSCALCMAAVALISYDLLDRVKGPSNVLVGVLLAVPSHSAVLAVSRLELYERLPWMFLPIGPLSYWAALGAGVVVVALVWYGTLL